MKNLYIDGQPDSNHKNCRYRIIADGTEYWLTGCIFEYLTRLAMATALNCPVTAKDLDKHGNVYKYLYRLKKELSGIEIICDSIGNYRLGINSKEIRFNHRQLAKYPHYDISKMFHM